MISFSIKVEDNDAWACAEISLTKNDDISCTEPELADDPSCSEPDSDLEDGELAQTINMVFWVDDGDNVLEDNEATGSSILAQGTAQQVLDGTKITLADSTGNIFNGSQNPLGGGQTYYIGKAWCFGTLTLDPLAQDAVEKFNTGGLEEKRYILSRLGSNLIIFNRRLRVDLEERLIPMKEASKETRRISDSLEPIEGVDRTTQLEVLYSQNPVLLRD